MCDALLIVPPTGFFIREDRCQTPIENLKTVAVRPPIDLLYIAGQLEREGISCEIIDYPVDGRSWDGLRQDLLSKKPKMLFASITTPSLPKDAKVFITAKEIDPHIVTITKGAHFRNLSMEALTAYPDLDVGIRGEYELTSVEIARAVMAGKWTPKTAAGILGITYREPIDFPQKDRAVKKNEDREFIQNLDDIAFPARHHIDNNLYIRPDTGKPQTTIITNRGCPFKCIYCLATKVAGTKLRARSTDNIVAEIRECVEKYGIHDFLFRADTFTMDKQWVLELCDKLSATNLPINWACNSRVDTIDEDRLRAMKRAGCWLIAYGVETGNEEILKNIKKGATLDQARVSIKLCKKVGIRTSVYFLLGLPWETEETFNDTVNFALEIKPDFIEFFYAYPFPGTELHKVANEMGLLTPGSIPEDAYSDPAIPSKFLSIDELKSLRKRALMKYYLRLPYIISTLSKARSPRALKNYIKYGFRQIKEFMT
jgi:radical SAM superfamily enzyme YgiQ (UPF0313 family)